MNHMMTHGSFDHQIAPKRSNSGREILYVQNQRVIGSQQNMHEFVPTSNPSVLHHGIPQDVMDAFDRLRHYSYRELYHYLKLDRQNELKHSSLRSSSIPEHRIANPRLSVASQASSAASSVFSNNPQRMSIASTNTTYSHFSDPGVGHVGFGGMPLHSMRQSQSPGSDMAMNLNRKKSSASLMLNSPSKTPSNRATLTAPLPRPSPRQSQSELEAKKKYFCTSCNKGFARKYDWKVHEQRYHEQQKQYPCPDCNVVLHAETLFKSHHRDAHGCQDCVHAKTQEREVEDKRRRTAWGCGFCGELLDEWEKRCDHVSAHYDEGVKRDSWDHSKVIVGLLKQEDIDQEWRTLLIQKHGQMPNPPLSMRWSKEATGRSHGENSQQLQDLLEFGACTRDAAIIAEMAYDLGLRPNIDGSSSPSREPSEGSSSSAVKSEPQLHEQRDSIMASPVNITPEIPFQPLNETMSNGYVDYPHVSAGMQQQHQNGSHTSIVVPTSMNMWPQYVEHNMMIQQHQYHNQNEQSIQAPHMDKALPPIPPDASEAIIPIHLHHPDSHSMTYDNWSLSGSLMGTTIAEDPMLTAATYAPQHYA